MHKKCHVEVVAIAGVEVGAEAMIVRDGVGHLRAGEEVEVELGVEVEEKVVVITNLTTLQTHRFT